MLTHILQKKKRIKDLEVKKKEFPKFSRLGFYKYFKTLVWSNFHVAFLCHISSSATSSAI